MAKIATKGTLLKHGVGTGPTVYTTVAQRVKLDGPDASMGDMELTDLDSAMVQTGPTLVDPGTFSGTLWYDPSAVTHQLFSAGLLSGAVDPWELVYPAPAGVTQTTPAMVAFTAFVSKFKPTGLEAKGYIQAEFELRLDGTTLTYTAAT